MKRTSERSYGTQENDRQIRLQDKRRALAEKKAKRRFTDAEWFQYEMRGKKS